jgi:lysophospholipase L1-like esterase
VCTLIATFAVAEVALRAMYHPENLEPVIRFDSALGWSLKPRANLRSYDDQTGLDYRIRTNSLGMREREVSERKPPGKKRILIIGDSIAFGTGVEAEWRFSDFLSRALGSDVEVLNAGVSGWGTDQELLYYEKIGKKLDPDVVILTFTMANDVINNMLDHLFLGSAPKPRFVIRDGGLRLDRETLDPPKTRFDLRVKRTLRRSRVLLLAKRRIGMLRYERRMKRADAEAHDAYAQSIKMHAGFDKRGLENEYSHWSVYESSYGPQFEDAWRVTEAIVDRFSRTCAENGADLIVFAFPLKLEVDSAWRDALYAHFAIDSSALDFHKPYERLANFCASRGIEFVYPLETFQKASRVHALYFARDSHPDIWGHAAAAGVLLPELHGRCLLDYHIAGADREFIEPLVGAVDDVPGQAPAMILHK